MSENLLDMLSIFITLSYIIAIIVIALSIADDVRQAPFRRSLHTKLAKPMKRRPHIVVVIRVQRRGDDIEECLRSVTKNRYKNYAVIVTDMTKSSVIRRQIATLSRKYKHSFRYSRARRVPRRYIPDDAIVISVTPSQRLPLQTLKRTATAFLLQPNVSIFNLPVVSAKGISIELATYQNVLSFMAVGNKARSLILFGRQQPRFPYAASAAAFRSNARTHVSYAVDIPIEETTVFRFGYRATVIGAALVLFTVLHFAAILLSLGYAVLTSVDRPLLYIWGLVTFTMSLAILLYEHASARQKALLLLSTPLSIFLFIAVILLVAWRGTTYYFKLVLRLFLRN